MAERRLSGQRRAVAPPLAEVRSFHRRRAARGLLTAPRRRQLVNFLFVAPWVLGFLVFTAGPMLASVVISLLDYNMLGAPIFIGLANYQEIFRDDPLFWKVLSNTAFYTFASVPLGVAGSLAVALLLNHKLRGINGFRTIFYLPSVTSAVAAAVLWRWIFDPDFGLANVSLGLVGIDGPGWLQSERWAMPALILMSLWGIGGGQAIILLAGLQGIPRELYEAAAVDGAGGWSRFRHVTIPMLSPSIFFALVVGFIGSFQIFTPSYLMTGGGPNNATTTLVLYLYNNAFSYFRMGYASALAWVLFAAILIFTLIQFRLARGRVHYEA